MKHDYELRKQNEDGSNTTVMEIYGEPKDVKEKVKEYTEKFRGLYTLKRVETVTIYFTEREIDKND